MKIIFDYNRTIFDPEAGELYPGVFDLIDELNLKHDLYLVSKAEAGRKEVLSNLGIDKFFKKVVFTDNKSKGTFEEIIESEKRVIVVGDRVRGEITIGNKLNCITVWVRQGKFSEEYPESEIEIPKHTINNIEELREIIKNYDN